MQKIKSLMKIVPTIVTISIFIALFLNVNTHQFLSTLLKVNLGFIIIIILFILLEMVVKSIRWQLFMKYLRVKLNFKESFYMNMAALSLIAITPSTSNDLLKSLYLKDRIELTKSAGAVFCEKVFDIVSLMFFTSIGLFFYYDKLILIVILAIFSVIIMIFVLSHYMNLEKIVGNKWNKRIKNLFEVFVIISKKPFRLIELFLITLLSWAVGFAQIVLIFYALNLDVPLFMIIGLMPVAIFIGLLPITIGGMGTRDGAIMILFSSFASKSELLGIGLVFSIFRYWVPSLMGLFFLRKINKTILKKRQLFDG